MEGGASDGEVRRRMLMCWESSAALRRGVASGQQYSKGIRSILASAVQRQRTGHHETGQLQKRGRRLLQAVRMAEVLQHNQQAAPTTAL